MFVDLNIYNNFYVTCHFEYIFYNVIFFYKLKNYNTFFCKSMIIVIIDSVHTFSVFEKITNLYPMFIFLFNYSRIILVIICF